MAARIAALSEVRGRLLLFATDAYGAGRESRGTSASSTWPGFARLPLEGVAFRVPHPLVLRSAKGASRRTFPWAPLARAFGTSFEAATRRLRTRSGGKAARSNCNGPSLRPTCDRRPRQPAPTSASATRRMRSSISRSGRTRAKPSRRRAGGSRRPARAPLPFVGPLKSRFVYLYATDIDGVDLVTGTATMCIDRGKFISLRRGQLLAARLAGGHLRGDRYARFVGLDDVPDRPPEVKSLPLLQGRDRLVRQEVLQAGSGNRASPDFAPGRADKARGSTAPPFAYAQRPHR